MSDHVRNSQDILEFSALRDMTPEIETHPIEEIRAAYERMLKNKAWFRVVL